jgi:membrane-associated HD superfamily phosphohydrolase
MSDPFEQAIEESCFQSLKSTAEDSPLLANRKEPQRVNQQERPNHRVFLELAAKGYDVKEIAAQTGYTPACINNALRQPHLQQTLVDAIHKFANEDEKVVELIKDNVARAVNVLVGIMHDKEAHNRDRISAAMALLDRRYGKPNQPLNRNTDVDLNSVSDKELLEKLLGN